MKKQCDVCGQELNFQKFRYKDGLICKACYQKASKNYTETITDKTREEIMALCRRETHQKKEWETFERTGKIGNYILFDDKHHSFCITHNRMNEKDMPAAEVIQNADIKKVTLYCEPEASREALREWAKCRDKRVIQRMEIRIWTKSQTGMRRIILLSTPVRIMSFAFRRVFGFAEKILDRLDEIREEAEASVCPEIKESI